MDIKLGAIPPPGARRDAIHVAIVAAMAKEELQPGERVRIDWYGLASKPPLIKPMESVGGTHGVVDPFLDRPVRRNEMFWLLMNPGSVSNLRHDWSHPAIEDESSDDGDNECRGC